MSGAIAKMRENWGAEAPDWIVVLAEACEKSSQRKVATEIGRSAATISHVLAKSYSGDLTGIEARVRGVYLSGTIHCPRLGEINSKTCRDWQDTARSHANTSLLRAQMYKACRRCPLFKGGSDDAS